MNTRVTLFTILLLLSALGAWAGVAFLTLSVMQAQTARASAAPVDQNVVQQIAATRTHILVQNMTTSKSQLEQIANVDLLTAINRLESVGKPVGVMLHVRDVSPESLGKQYKGPIHAVGFSMEAEGTYAGLVTAVRLLDSMSLPIAIEQYDLSLTPVINGLPASRTPWHLSIRVRILTTSNIAS